MKMISSLAKVYNNNKDSKTKIMCRQLSSINIYLRISTVYRYLLISYTNQVYYCLQSCYTYIENMII